MSVNSSEIVNVTGSVTVGSQADVVIIDKSVTTLYMRKFSRNASTDAMTYVEQLTVANSDGRFAFSLPGGYYYQLWKSSYPDVTSGNEITNWHGSGGKYKYIADDIADLEKVKNTLAQNKVTNLTTDLAAKASLSANQDFSGKNNFLDEVSAEFADHDITTNPNHIVTVQRLNNALSSFQGSVIYGNIIFVDPNGADVAGQQYNTLLEAVNYCSSNFSPTALKPSLVVILENASGTGYVSAPAGCFVNHVHIQGFSKNIKIVPAETTLTVTTALYNITVLATTSARTYSLMSLYDVFFQHDENLTLQAGKAHNCIFAGADGKTMTFGKSGGVYCDVLKCVSRLDPDFIDGESYDGGRDCSWQSKLRRLS